jgi:hypothetical protein
VASTQAYEQVEDEAIKAERSRAQARRTKELMEKQMVQCKNLEQAFLQVRPASLFYPTLSLGLGLRFKANPKPQRVL